MVFFDIFSKRRQDSILKRAIVDSRESNSLVPSELQRLGFQIEFVSLSVADYLINNIAIERKTVSDFKSSIIDKRLIKQLAELKQYKKSFLILEGVGPLMYSKGIHENAFRSFLLSVVLDYQIPLIYTLNETDTAKYISVLANKKERSAKAVRATKIALTKEEQIQFILEGFPGVGPVTANKLVERFQTLKNIINAKESELEEILGKKAERFLKTINHQYPLKK